jgi:hypothetical protein
MRMERPVPILRLRPPGFPGAGKSLIQCMPPRGDRLKSASPAASETPSNCGPVPANERLQSSWHAM